jgi:uncharacterized oxidoreductase
MRIKAEALRRTVERIFAAAGCAAAEASCVAGHLVDANLCGHDSHGVIRVARYLGYMREDKIRPGGQATVVFESDTVAVIDGNMGFGQVVGEQAMDLLAAKARKSGLAMTTIRNSGHVGRLGGWAERLARDGLVSWHFVNTTGIGMWAAPFGGTDRRLSVNPLSICVPVDGRHPILLDMSSTVVAEGKVAIARNKGVPLPPGAIIDKAGNPSTDPNDLYAGGALLTMAEHKGYALNVMIDLLAGALSGGGCTAPGATSLVNTMTSIAVDPAPFTDRDAYLAEIKRYAEWVTGSPPRQAGGRVQMPGDFEHETRRERDRKGIPLDPATWDQIVESAASVGLTGDDVDACVAEG